MWRNWNPLNPPINEQSSEDEQNNYESADEHDPNNLISPNRPHQSPSASPRALLRPDPPRVEEVLAEVTQNLRNLPNREERVERRNAVRRAQEEAEAALAVEAVIMPAPVVNFEDKNGNDRERTIEHTRSLKIEYNATDVAFWFTQLENEMITCHVKSQWLKRVVLVKNLPAKIQNDVKALLILQKAEAPADLYKQIKKEILRIHAPKQEDSFKKALSRVLVGLPSQLGQTLINDVCQKSTKLTGCCCAGVVWTLWCLQLPLGVRSYVANMDFNAATYNAVFQAADKVYLSTKDTEMSPQVAAVATSVAKPKKESGEVPEVAGVSAPKGNRQNRGNGRGGYRGNNSRGGGSGRGQGRGPLTQLKPPQQLL